MRAVYDRVAETDQDSSPFANRRPRLGIAQAYCECAAKDVLEELRVDRPKLNCIVSCLSSRIVLRIAWQRLIRAVLVIENEDGSSPVHLELSGFVPTPNVQLLASFQGMMNVEGVEEQDGERVIISM